MKRIVLCGLGFLFVLMVVSAQAQSPGGPNFQGTINFFLGTELGGTVGVRDDSDIPRHLVVDPAGHPLVLSPFGSPVGIGLEEPNAPGLHVQNSSEPESGERQTTIRIEHAIPDQDVLIGFLGQTTVPPTDPGATLSILGVVLNDSNPRFVVRGGADFVGLNITLAEDGGNVGIGTATPQSALQVIGYTQLDLTSGAPPGADCDEAAERGRMVVDNAAGSLYVCVDSGWVAK